ncbi:MAG: peptide chain release factor N(5)-glutamine methyltransferase [Prevotellaceae bacterium]|jgi:release factor glutamine methyltransferase|nr:peptide chain release factor N(5)-glutamine methyltransferase [Prevotellaceae bacterium]
MTIRDLRDKYLKPLTKLYDKQEACSLILRVITHYSHLTLTQIYAYPETKLEARLAIEITKALDEICTKRPLQYVLGQADFFGRRFFVNSDVLIPRPETEELVWVAMNDSKGKSLDILDIGTGSGCIAVSLACELPQAEVFAIDISEPALNTAARNAERSDTIVHFAKHDILSDTELPFGRKFDIFVSNPPYVRISEQKLMHDNVLRYEPHIALFVSDESPLIFYEACIRLAFRYLKPKGTIYAEINEELGEATRLLFTNAGFDAEIIKDISNKDRIIVARS